MIVFSNGKVVGHRSYNLMSVGRSCGPEGASMSRVSCKSALTLSVSVGALLASLGLIESAAAQSAAPQADRKVEKVVVTARKRSEQLQDIPGSVSVVGGEEAKNRNAQRVRDLQNVSPNVIFTGSENNSLARITVRGIESQPRQNVGSEAGLGVYVDGVVQGRLTTFNQEAIGIERVEFLRGPQGTLYGKNTISGAINVITRQPDLERSEWDLRARYTDLEELSFFGYASTPFGNEGKAAAAVTGFRIQRDGYIRNLFNGNYLGDDDAHGGRLKLRFAPSDNWDLTISLDAAHDDSVGADSQRIVGPGALAGTNVTNVNTEPLSRRDYGGASATWNAKLGDHTLTSITAYRWANNDRSSDTDGGPANSQFTTQVSDQTQFSQELRIASPVGASFDYIVGAYFYSQSIFGNTSGSIVGLGEASIQGDIDTEQFAVFANANWHITDALTLFGGARFTSESKDLAYRQVGSLTGVFVPALPLESDSLTDDDLSPTIGVQYDLSDDAMIYVSASRGFRSGGWNVEPITSFLINSFKLVRFDSESVWSYEAGLKTSWWDDRVILNAAAFYIDYKDIQVATRVELPPPFAPGVFASLIDNAAEATSTGAEVELRAQLSENISLGGMLGVVDTEYDRYFEPVTLLNFAGKELNGAPDMTLGLFGEVFVPMGDLGSMLLRADYRHVGSFFTERTNDPRQEIPEVDIVNGRLRYLSPGEQFEVALFANNLFDEDIIVARTSNVSGSVQTVTRDRPRVVGIEIGFKN